MNITADYADTAITRSTRDWHTDFMGPRRSIEMITADKPCRDCGVKIRYDRLVCDTCLMSPDMWVDKAIQVPTDRETWAPRHDQDSNVRDWHAKASEVKVGDRYRSLGSGYIQRQVESVKTMCNCHASARTIDPETREPRHYPVVCITGGNMGGTYPLDSTLTLTNGTF
jgi:hypothetical protein